MLLALTALASTSLALATELTFSCTGRRTTWLMRPGPFGLGARRVYRTLDRAIPLLSGTAAGASFLLAVTAGVTTRAGWVGLAGVLALGAHLAFYAQVARPFQADGGCLELSRIPPRELAALKDRWELVMNTRASLLTAAFVCLLARLLLA